MKAHVIYGPPGTGKTRTLINLTAEILKRNPAHTVTFLSHTRAAALEARERIQERGLEIPAENCSTLHSLAYRLTDVSKAQVVTAERLRAFGDEIGIPITARSPDSEEQIDTGDELLAIYNLARARLTDPMDEYMRSHRPGDIELYKFFVRSYLSWKDSHGYVDFNDMLERAVHPDRVLRHPFKAFIIDEAQDLSPLQWALVKKLTADAALVYVAGDDDQAIYVWGGADPTAMPRWEQETGAARKVLGQSWRIPASVHRLAHKIIGSVSDRVEKEYLPRDEEGEVNYHESLSSVKWKELGDTLVLYRNHASRREIEDELIFNRVPYRADSGPPSPLDNRWGKAVRLHRRVKYDGYIPSEREREALMRVATARGRSILEKYEWGTFADTPWTALIDVPYHLADYLQRVDWSAPVQVRLSSIHQAKGREADTVVLFNSMTQRTYEGMAQDPDQEARVWYVAVTRARHRLDIVQGEMGYSL